MSVPSLSFLCCNVLRDCIDAGEMSVDVLTAVPPNHRAACIPAGLTFSTACGVTALPDEVELDAEDSLRHAYGRSLLNSADDDPDLLLMFESISFRGYGPQSVPALAGFKADKEAFNRVDKPPMGDEPLSPSPPPSPGSCTSPSPSSSPSPSPSPPVHPNPASMPHFNKFVDMYNALVSFHSFATSSAVAEQHRRLRRRRRLPKPASRYVPPPPTPPRTRQPSQPASASSPPLSVVLSPPRGSRTTPPQLPASRPSRHTKLPPVSLRPSASSAYAHPPGGFPTPHHHHHHHPTNTTTTTNRGLALIGTRVGMTLSPAPKRLPRVRVSKPVKLRPPAARRGPRYSNAHKRAAVVVQRVARGWIDRSYAAHYRVHRLTTASALPVCLSVPELFECHSHLALILPPAVRVCPNLTTLSTRGCTGLTSDLVALIAVSLPRLTSLDLSGFRDGGDADLLALSSLSALRELQVCGWSNLTGDGLLTWARALAPVRWVPAVEPGNVQRAMHGLVPTRLLMGQRALHVPALRALNLADCVALSSEGVSRAGSELPGLEDLCVFGCLKLDDAALLGLGNVDSRLSRLCTAGAYKIGRGGVRFLLAHNPHVLLYNRLESFGEKRVEVEGADQPVDVSDA